MSVLANQRLRRKQLLREAEGYLDLATVFADRWPLPVQLRDGLRSVRWIRSGSSVRRADVAHGGLSRGQALRIMERHEDAITALERSAELDPSNIHIWLAWAGATSARAGWIWPFNRWKKHFPSTRIRRSCTTTWPATGASLTTPSTA